MVMSLSYLGAKVIGDHTLYEVDLVNRASGKFVLRPISGQPYKWLEVPAKRLRDRNLWQLYPIFSFAMDPRQVEAMS